MDAAALAARINAARRFKVGSEVHGIEGVVFDLRRPVSFDMRRASIKSRQDVGVHDIAAAQHYMLLDAAAGWSGVLCRHLDPEAPTEEAAQPVEFARELFEQWLERDTGLADVLAIECYRRYGEHEIKQEATEKN